MGFVFCLPYFVCDMEIILQSCPQLLGCEIKIGNQSSVSNYGCYFQKVFLLLASLQSSKACSDNKFRQRKMSSLCIVGIVLFGAPEGISKYVSTVINQDDKRTEITLCFSFAPAHG